MTSKYPDSFTDRLLNQQQMDDSLRKRYEQQLDSTFERPMTSWERTKEVINFVSCIGFSILFAYAAVARPDLSQLKRNVAAAAVPVALFIAVLRLRSFLRAKINIRLDRRFKRMIVIVEIIVATLLALYFGFRSADTQHAIMVLLALTWLGVAVCAVQMRMLLAELRASLTEQNLELQYRMLELADVVKKGVNPGTQD